jgi:hypothetical protein
MRQDIGCEAGKAPSADLIDNEQGITGRGKVQQCGATPRFDLVIAEEVRPFAWQAGEDRVRRLGCGGINSLGRLHAVVVRGDPDRQ